MGRTRRLRRPDREAAHPEQFVRHAGRRRGLPLDTPDDVFTVDELHVEVDRTYHFRLESRDVLHSFSVPVFRLKQDAIPGRSITGWFRPTVTGEYDVQCAEICGIGHGVMAARIFIEDANQHATWMSAASAATAP